MRMQVLRFATAAVLAWSVRVGTTVAMDAEDASAQPSANEETQAEEQKPSDAVVLLPAPAAARDGVGRIGLGGGAGDEGQAYWVEALLPFWQSDNAVLFLNPRFALLSGDQDDSEYNLGLVARRLAAGSSLLLGVNAYFDSRAADSGSVFNRAGAGVELFSRWADLRANYYYPLTDARILRSYEETAVAVSGNRRTTTVTSMREYEEFLEGFDVEIGFGLPWISRFVPLSLHLGYERMESDVVSVVLDGWRGRAEARPHPNVTLDFEWFDQAELRNAEYFAGMRLCLPLDFWRGTALKRGSGGDRAAYRMSDRLGEPVRRAFRMRTWRSGPVVVASTQNEKRLHTEEAVLEKERVCYDVATLDEYGNVVIVRVCE
jgi:hypothetical protein